MMAFADEVSKLETQHTRLLAVARAADRFARVFSLGGLDAPAQLVVSDLHAALAAVEDLL
jgi:hypothetical protein